MDTRTIPRLVIAGAHSGVGKTTITVGLLAALRRRGLTVQPFKAGPDFIDPTYHSLAAGRPCHNLDTWMVAPARIRVLCAHASAGADLAVVEGAMGLYDGFEYTGESGSTAQLAKLLAAPTILVLDVSAMARSAGALALGYQRFDSGLALAGFIANRAGGQSHAQGIEATIGQATGLPLLGWLPGAASLAVPERHLGLIPTAEPGRWHGFVEAAADLVAAHLDLDRLLAIAWDAPPLSVDHPLEELSSVQTLHARRRPIIAVAQDEAFSFTYAANLDLLQAAGAEIVTFSPLRDAGLPPGTAGIVLSGGFPERYAGQLAANRPMQEALRRAHPRHLPIYAECGGLMALTGSITDLEGRVHPIVGLLPGRAVMGQQLTLGYRRARAASNSWLLAAGEEVRGHEFHYSTWEDRPPELTPAYHLLPPDGKGEPPPEGACLGTLWASYVHLHFWSRPDLATRFVEACARADSESS